MDILQLLLQLLQNMKLQRCYQAQLTNHLMNSAMLKSKSKVILSISGFGTWNSQTRCRNTGTFGAIRP